MKHIIIKCDICDKQKTETNHWLLWQAKYDDNDNIQDIRFVPWNDKDICYPLIGHLCSQGCATSLFQKFLEQNTQTNV